MEECVVKSYYIRFGTRHRVPSTVEILDELRDGYAPNYVRKSWAANGFKRPNVHNEETAHPGAEPAEQMTSASERASLRVFPPV